MRLIIINEYEVLLFTIFFMFYSYKTQTPVVSGNFKINIAPYKKKKYWIRVFKIFIINYFCKDSKK